MSQLHHRRGFISWAVAYLALGFVGLASLAVVGSVVGGSEQMSIWQAAILGVVEGVTEYLPISSTGHLILAERAMGMEKSEVADAFAICIQAGAIVAVLLIYMGRVKQVVRGMYGQDAGGRRLGLLLILACVPAAVVGLLFGKWIEEYLFGLKPIVFAWFVGGVAILVVHFFRGNRRPIAGLALENLTARSALVIGLMQCIAMWPGTSRSLVTILGGLWVGLSMPAAVEFSFLLGLITLSAATGYKGLKHGPQMVEAFGWLPILMGFATASLSAFVAVRWMVGYLNRHSLAVFGYYRVALAVVVAVLIACNIL